MATRRAWADAPAAPLPGPGAAGVPGVCGVAGGAGAAGVPGIADDGGVPGIADADGVPGIGGDDGVPGAAAADDEDDGGAVGTSFTSGACAGDDDGPLPTAPGSADRPPETPAPTGVDAFSAAPQSSQYSAPAGFSF
jgi:hypothetical protein